MTAQPSESAMPAHKYPAKTLNAISHVLDSNEVDADVRQRFLAAYAKAWAAARDGQTVQPLLNLVEAWFPEAVLWSDPDDARAYNAKIDDYVRNGIPAESRGNALRTVAELRAKHGNHPAFDKLERLAARP